MIGIGQLRVREAAGGQLAAATTAVAIAVKATRRARCDPAGVRVRDHRPFRACRRSDCVADGAYRPGPGSGIDDAGHA